MYRLARRSRSNLYTCCSELILLFDTAIKTTPQDFSIICGHRGELDQNEMFIKGTSRLKYPHSKHNRLPSDAADIQPYLYTNEDINDVEHKKFRILSEHIKKVAQELKIDVINGGLDWGWDWFHWEIVR